MLQAFSREKYLRLNTMQLFIATAAIIKIRQYQASINILYRRLESTSAIAKSYQSGGALESTFLTRNCSNEALDNNFKNHGTLTEPHFLH